MIERADTGGRRAVFALGRWLFVAFLLFTVAMPMAVRAQATGTAIPGPTRDELGGITRTPTEARPRLTVSGGIERAACPLAAPQFQDIKTTIADVTFNGLKGADAAEMEAAWKPLAGTAQPIAVLCEIRDAAATILRNKGYLAAVQVPVQRIEDGHVRMEVLYARVTAIRARGQTRGAERKLHAYLAQLTEGAIFDSTKAERYLLLARDLPGYNVQLSLRPAGTAPGDLIGDVTVLRQPFVVDFSVQNLASAATGRWGGQLRAQVFGLTGLGDATTVSYYATSDFREQRIVQASHEFRPGREGLIVGGAFTYAWTRPDIGPTPTPLEARTLLASLYARYPLSRAQRGNLWLGAGFDVLDQTTTFIVPLSHDKLRLLWTRLDYDSVDLTRPDPAWRFSGSLELRQGLAGLGATHACGSVACNDANRSPAATVLRGQVEYERALGKLAVSLSPRGQYGFRRVLGFESFAPGNYTVGRGYDPGAITGDSGVGIAAELRGPRLRLALGAGEGPRVQPYAFADAAWAWNRATSAAERLTSVGGGLRAQLGDRFRLDAALAVPLERTGLAGVRPATRMLVTLTTRLLPWGGR